ncbi:hypothetical protein PENTCL1PPCAC_24779, partial [Pristionchus entomophagus]
QYSALRDKLIRYLYELCGSTLATREMLEEQTATPAEREQAAACRLSRIMFLYSNVAILCNRSSKNTNTFELLQT